MKFPMTDDILTGDCSKRGDHMGRFDCINMMAFDVQLLIATVQTRLL